MSKHTPGPWSVYLGSGTQPGIESEFIGQSIVVWGHNGEETGVRGASTEEAQANARLIAAAPVMLQTLREVLAQLEAPPGQDPAFIVNGGQVPQYTLTSLRQAIAAAE